MEDAEPSPKSLGAILRNEARDAAVFTGTTLFSKLGAFLVLPLYWRKLTPEDYGVIAIIGLIGAFQRLFGTLSLDLGVTRLYFEWAPEDRARNLGALWVWSWLATVVCGGLFLLLTPFVDDAVFPSVAFDPYLFYGIVGNAMASLFTIPAAAIRARRMPWLFATYNLLSFVATTALGLWYVLVRDEGLEGYLVSQILANGAIAVFGAFAMFGFARPCLRSPGLDEALRFSLRALPASFIGTVGTTTDRFLLNYFATLETLGIYAISTRFIDLITSLHTSLKMAFGPFMMKEISENEERGKAAVVALTPFYLIPYFAAGIALVLFIDPLIRVVDQPSYYPVVEWVPWLAGLGVLTTMNFYYCNGMVLAHRTELLSIPAGVNLVLLIASGVLLVPTYQLPGLVLSRYIGAGVFFGQSLALSQRVFPIRQRWDKLIGLTFGAIGLAVLAPYLALDNPVLDAAVKLPIFAAFVIGSFFFVRGRSSRKD